MISYVQNGEDVLLNRALGGVSEGFYIDVGANDPVEDSVTKHFYDLGWHGVNVEPLPEMFRKLQALRERDVNLHVGLLERVDKMVFYEVEGVHGWSTFSEEVAQQVRNQGKRVVEHTMAVRTLADVCAEHAKGTIDFLKVDVEGMEKRVLQGADFVKYRPRIVLVETAGDAHKEWEGILTRAGYVFALFDGINRFYARGEEPALLEKMKAPVNCTDDYVPWRYVVRERAGKEGIWGKVKRKWLGR